MNDDELFMSKIQNYNCDGLCSEKYCSERYTHFFTQELNGLKLIIAFCKKHAQIYEDNLWENRK